MLILQANKIQKSYGARTVLDFPQFLLYAGDRIGIVGANGAGKSTLLGILSGDISPDSGHVVRDWKVACIRQQTAKNPTRSGGENAKADILGQAGHSGQILFADEPTANLDADGQLWVRQRLAAADTLLLVSHDRTLLDAVCNKIVAVKDGALTTYTGNYTDYEAAVALEREQQSAAYDQYRHKRSQLETAMEIKSKKASRITAPPTRVGNSEARLFKHHYRAKQKTVERSRKTIETRLEKLTPVEKLREPPALRIDFSLTNPPGNRNVITGQNVSFAYGDHVVLRDASLIVPNRAKLAITGKNGSGKTTLLRLIYEGGAGITSVPKLRPGFLYQSFENLDMGKTVLENVQSGSIQDHAAVRSVLAGLLFFGGDIHKQAAVLSGGEKMRLSLAKLLTCDANALLLDEPTNYLDLRALEAVRNMILQYPGTVLLVSHDAHFVQSVANRRLHIQNGAIIPMPLEQEERAAATPVERTLLEIRLTGLVSAISSAPQEEKAALEAQYHTTLEQLRGMR